MGGASVDVDGAAEASSPLLLPRSAPRPAVSAEVTRQVGLAAPLVACSLLQYCLQVVSVMFAGHLGELSLSGASVAASFANVTGFSVLLGMGSALDTFCGQSYGARQYDMLGTHTQRAIIVLMFTGLPLAFVLAFTGQILIALGQNPEISFEAGLYAQWLIPGLFAYGLLQCLTRFLQAQNIVHILVACSGLTLLLHVMLCWLLVQSFGLGHKGAALATSVSYWFNVALLAVYVKFSEAGRRSWHGWSGEALKLKDAKVYLKLAIPSTFMTCLEYWAFEMVVLLAGFLPDPKLETSILSVSLNTMWMVYTIPSGLSSAISIRVSNELVLVRDVWGYLYSNEEEVVKHVSIMMPILATSDFMDGIQCTLSGAARGCGWQKVCSVINLFAYYAIGLPSAVTFAFVLKIGGKGLWLGIICAMAVQIFALVVMMLQTNWNEEDRPTSAYHFASIKVEFTIFCSRELYYIYCTGGEGGQALLNKAEKARARVQCSDGSITLI
ncbi:putative MATE efflux family protein isoform X2 [Zea mays]|uniref:putative MATE efflux family protein isoform X2 n=1 Tax=Zea mays TaxID=4577 RepID=UPI000C6C6378|nr:putative MATE efflux family protein isoform X2 [Zea mays]|eukprot:XP_023156032.1 putative MATE efflux family protein isoform X2 [Zea mays]